MEMNQEYFKYFISYFVNEISMKTFMEMHSLCLALLYFITKVL